MHRRLSLPPRPVRIGRQSIRHDGVMEATSRRNEKQRTFCLRRRVCGSRFSTMVTRAPMTYANSVVPATSLTNAVSISGTLLAAFHKRNPNERVGVNIIGWLQLAVAHKHFCCDAGSHASQPGRTHKSRFSMGCYLRGCVVAGKSTTNAPEAIPTNG